MKATWISKEIKDEVEESGISVNEITKTPSVLQAFTGAPGAIMSANKPFGTEESIGMLVSNFCPPTFRMIRFV